MDHLGAVRRVLAVLCRRQPGALCPTGDHETPRRPVTDPDCGRNLRWRWLVTPADPTDQLVVLDGGSPGLRQCAVVAVRSR